ncbi:antiholin-like murein hydrolase modulator LrgA [Staphylococcus edaphicus]|uniref:Antiholin-like murein hydrolase modulator LrgA n=1 Tax=Staphylococcus edaphicus TaxID=1955013 RepID=A0A2C6WP37_9STAP|nr:antiholin-like murein hydrolase modulator LrgA [Staphylococcus edaphicus]PHK49564.1 murein hydrolase transporter LrgA [Staphylococcus edaphicus]UQW81996.1 antiholin-like murein hydrolase modulator LrgA [Staphylococcus edaphicus]
MKVEKEQHSTKDKSSKTYNFFHQALVIAIIMFISNVIESFMPVPMPASVIGLVLLFVALCTGIVKLGEVETVGTTLTNNIGFLFVPAGVSVINSLGVLSTSPILITLLIIISTLLLLLCTGFFSQMLITKSFIPRKSKHKQLAEDEL